jgi:hypothetical protein
MDFKHRITVNSTDSFFISALADLGVEHKTINLPGKGGTLITIIIFESDSRWNNVIQLVKRQTHFEIYGNGDLFETVFSEDEIKGAEWLRLISTFEQGYPQPKSQWPLKQLSYDITCSKCCVHRQIGCMRFAKEPSLRRKSFMSLIWTGEIFCTPEVIQELEKIEAKGYEVWDAVIHKTGKPSEKVRQLFIPGVTLPGMIDDNLERKTCSVCGITKYYPHMKGKMYLRRDALLTDTDFLLTDEWFGCGYIAFREVLISNRVARLILEKGWKGIRMKVVELV